MTDADYLDLIVALKEQLAAVGLAHLADDERYVSPYEDRRLPPPRIQLKEMLASLERHLAVRDYQTYDRSMKVIRATSRAEEFATRRSGSICPC